MIEEAEISFTDFTLSETDGLFKEVNEIMNNTDVGEHDWCVRSDVTIKTSFGSATMTVQCKYDKSINIIDFAPSIRDAVCNPDIIALSIWAKEYGWERIEPIESLVKSDKPFWLHFYETNVIESKYLDKIIIDNKEY